MPFRRRDVIPRRGCGQELVCDRTGLDPAQARGTAMETAEDTNAGPVYSEFRGDEDYAEVLAEFLRSLGQRVDEFERALRCGDRDTLRRLAHQLKGAGGGYGYPGLSEHAADLEREADGEDAPRCWERLRAYMNRLAD